MDEKAQGWHYRYGPIIERRTADVIRSIGCLTRRLLDTERPAEAEASITYLDQKYASLRPDEDRSIVVGLTTALGFLGDWEPILTHLGAGEPWMHVAARNVFEKWMPGPLVREPEGERERAVRWINLRLRANPDLPTEVRSTLSRIKDSLESWIGRHIVEEGAG